MAYKPREYPASHAGCNAFAVVISKCDYSVLLTTRVVRQGFFVPYLTGAIVLVVLAVGSTAPGLLQVDSTVMPRQLTADSHCCVLVKRYLQRSDGFQLLSSSFSRSQVFTNLFRTAFPDFRERVLRHEVMGDACKHARLPSRSHLHLTVFISMLSSLCWRELPRQATS